MISRIKGNLIVISGPSGSGKGTICQGLHLEETDLRLSVSATSRKPRDSEENGREYYFLSREQFETMIAEEQFLEWAQVYGNYYGTPKKPVLDLLAKGIDVILEIDVQGALQVKDSYPEGVLIFLAPPSRAELARRLKNRGSESEEDIACRLQWASQELAQMSKYDFMVFNDDFGQALREIKAIITAQKCRTGLFDSGQFLEHYA